MVLTKKDVKIWLGWFQFLHYIFLDNLSSFPKKIRREDICDISCQQMIQYLATEKFHFINCFLDSNLSIDVIKISLRIYTKIIKTIYLSIQLHEILLWTCADSCNFLTNMSTKLRFIYAQIQIFDSSYVCIDTIEIFLRE